LVIAILIRFLTRAMILIKEADKVRSEPPVISRANGLRPGCRRPDYCGLTQAALAMTLSFHKIAPRRS
jgi:hypothetical protein